MARLVEIYKPRFGKEQIVSDRELKPGQTVILGTEQKGRETVVASLHVSSEDPLMARVDFTHLRTGSTPSQTIPTSIEGRGEVILGRTKFTFES